MEGKNKNLKTFLLIKLWRSIDFTEDGYVNRRVYKADEVFAVIVAPSKNKALRKINAKKYKIKSHILFNLPSDETLVTSKSKLLKNDGGGNYYLLKEVRSI